jgi:hypothetical protein
MGMRMSQAQATESTPQSTSDGVYELFILALTIISLLMVAAFYLPPLS